MTKIRKVPNATEKLAYYSLNGMEFRASHPPKCREFYVRCEVITGHSAACPSETWTLETTPSTDLRAENFHFGNFRQLLNDIANVELVLI